MAGDRVAGAAAEVVVAEVAEDEADQDDQDGQAGRAGRAGLGDRLGGLACLDGHRHPQASY